MAVIQSKGGDELRLQVMTEIELDTPSLSEELGGAAVLPLGEAPPHLLLPGEGGVGSRACCRQPK